MCIRDRMERLLILDSNSLLNRAFYAIPPLTNSEGIHTNAVYGFTNMLFKMKEEIKPDYIVAAFDRKAPTFRHKEYEDYKAGRKKMPPELGEQFPLVKEVLNLLAVNIYEIDGFEAVSYTHLGLPKGNDSISYNGCCFCIARINSNVYDV